MGDPYKANKYFGKTIPYHCYIDESGHTGLNHFDENQRYFFLGCAISKVNLDSPELGLLEDIYKKIENAELHGHELGEEKLSLIYEEFEKIVVERDIQFVFVSIDKLFHLAVMMFHQFYDNGLNQGVNIGAQAIRHLRLLLSYKFVHLLEIDDLQEFWVSVKGKDIEKYRNLLKRLSLKLDVMPLDKRSRELLKDALEYTIENPVEIFNSMSFNQMCSPNISAFALLLNTIQGIFRNKRVHIERIVHDEQKEFGKFLKKSYGTLSKFFMPTTPTSFITELIPKKLLENAELELLPSKSSEGIQIVDTALWVYKRMFQNKPDLKLEKFRKLINDRSYLTGISFEMHKEELLRGMNILYSADKKLTPERIAAAEKLVGDMEKNRWKVKG